MRGLTSLGGAAISSACLAFPPLAIFKRSISRFRSLTGTVGLVAVSSQFCFMYDPSELTQLLAQNQQADQVVRALAPLSQQHLRSQVLAEVRAYQRVVPLVAALALI
jgi:hypothetical protein